MPQNIDLSNVSNFLGNNKPSHQQLPANILDSEDFSEGVYNYGDFSIFTQQNDMQAIRKYSEGLEQTMQPVQIGAHQLSRNSSIILSQHRGDDDQPEKKNMMIQTPNLPDYLAQLPTSDPVKLETRLLPKLHNVRSMRDFNENSQSYTATVEHPNPLQHNFSEASIIKEGNLCIN